MSFVWGIDPSTTRLAIAACDEHDFNVVRPCSFDTTSPGQGGERLYEMRIKVIPALRAMAREYPPCIAFIEQPAGKFVSPISWFAMGQIMECVYEYVQVPCFPLQPSKWKLALYGKGHGNCGKPYIWDWAIEYGLDPQNQDEADACAISVIGRRMWEHRVFDVAALS